MNPFVILILLAGAFGTKAYIDSRKKSNPKCVGRVWRQTPTDDPINVDEAPAACTDPNSNAVTLGWTYTEPDGAMYMPYIVEGNRFEPLSLGVFDYNAIEADSLAETLAIPGNSVYGFVDYLMNVGGMDDAKTIATQIAKEALAGTDLEDWYKGPGAFGEADSFVYFVERWRDSLASRISGHVAEAGGIPFEPGD